MPSPHTHTHTQYYLLTYLLKAEALLVALTTLLEISCRGSNICVKRLISFLVDIREPHQDGVLEIK